MVRVFAFRVEEEFDVLEHVLSGRFPSVICVSTDPFLIQQLEEALGDGVIMVIAASAHAGYQIVLSEERLPFSAGELRALKGTHLYRVCRFASPDGHKKGLQRNARGHAGLRGQADYAAGEQIDDDTEIQPVLMGLNVGEIGDPDLIEADASNRCSSLFSDMMAGLPPYRPGRRL